MKTQAWSWFALALTFAAGCGDDASGPGIGTGQGGEGAPCETGDDCVGGLQCLPGADGGMSCGALVEEPDAGPECDPQNITVTPTNIDFGSPLLGTETIEDLTIVNTGCQSLTIYSIFAQDFTSETSGLPEFSVTTETPPIVIAGGDSEVFSVIFRALDGVADIGQVTIVNNDPDPVEAGTIVALVSQVKGDPELDICVLTTYPPDGEITCDAEPDEIDFGEVPYEDVGTRYFSLRNIGDGNATLTIEEVDIDDEHFSIDVGGGGLFTIVEDASECDAEVVNDIECPEALPFVLRPGDPMLPPPFDQPNRLYARVTFTPSATPPIDGLVPSEFVQIETDLLPPEHEASIPVAGSIVGCRPGYVNADGNTLNGCEYACIPTGNPETACDGIDDDCDNTTAGTDEDYEPYICGVGACARTSTCAAGGVENCTEGIPDNDDDCDGTDDDCDETPDDDWIPYTCGLGPCAAVATCEAGVETCAEGTPGTEVCDGGTDEDCDGFTDEEDPEDGDDGFGTCAGAPLVGEVLDSAGGVIPDLVGRIHAGDEDWYVVNGLDDVDDCGDEFDFQVCFTTNPGGALRLDVYRRSCPPTSVADTCTDVPDSVRWQFTCPDGTDCCVAAGAGGEAAVDFGGAFYIRVYRASDAVVDCGEYHLKVTNGPGLTCP
ncbi:MAG: choice-of-anchor D domain-containing protein [Myxococcota bacterium]